MKTINKIKELEKRAIKAILKGKWEEAVFLNQEILKKEPTNIPALNRLARAYWGKGELKKAKETYQKTLRLDEYNAIALKNLARLTKKGTNALKTKDAPPVTPTFLEEPGKTKTVSLTRLAGANILSCLASGEEVQLIPRKRTINIITQEGVYLGALPDDLSLRLIYLIKKGNRYRAWVKTVARHQLKVFIRETTRNKKLRSFPSFPTLPRKK